MVFDTDSTHNVCDEVMVQTAQSDYVCYEAAMLVFKNGYDAVLWENWKYFVDIPN